MSEKARLQNLIADSQEEEVIEILKTTLQVYMSLGENEKFEVEEAYNQLIILSSNCKNTFSQFRLNTIDSKDFAVMKAQLNQALLMFVNQLPILFYQYLDTQKELVHEKTTLNEQAYQILHLNPEAITADLLKQQYQKLQTEYQIGLEKSPQRLKKHFQEQLLQVEKAFELIYSQIKSVEDKYLNECYIVLECEKGISFDTVQINYLEIKKSYLDLLKSENLSIRNLAQSEIQTLEASFLYLVSCDYMVRIEGNSAFYIDRYPVTVAQYRYYCQKTGRKMPRTPAWGWIDTHPIVNVNWKEAQDFAEYFGKRLPTEIEWEKAARGGRYSQNFLFSGSNQAQEVAWYKDNANQQTQAVGLKRPNELGIYDMSGNVWEWCQDSYASTQQYKILKGGSWKNLKESATISRRDNEDLDAHNPINGFRCVKS